MSEECFSQREVRCKTWKTGKHFIKALGCPHVLQSTLLFWWGGRMFRKGKMCLISHFRIIGKLEEDAIPCNKHSPSFLKCLKAKAFEAPHETESLARGRRHAGARPLLYPTPRAKLPGSKAGVLRPTRRGVYSEDTFPQLWQVLHFHALLKGKYQSKTGTGKQVMSLKNYF